VGRPWGLTEPRSLSWRPREGALRRLVLGLSLSPPTAGRAENVKTGQNDAVPPSPPRFTRGLPEEVCAPGVNPSPGPAGEREVKGSGCERAGLDCLQASLSAPVLSFSTLCKPQSTLVQELGFYNPCYVTG